MMVPQETPRKANDDNIKNREKHNCRRIYKLVQCMKNSHATIMHMDPRRRRQSSPTRSASNSSLELREIPLAHYSVLCVAVMASTYNLHTDTQTNERVGKI